MDRPWRNGETQSIQRANAAKPLAQSIGLYRVHAVTIAGTRRIPGTNLDRAGNRVGDNPKAILEIRLPSPAVIPRVTRDRGLISTALGPMGSEK